MAMVKAENAIAQAGGWLSSVSTLATDPTGKDNSLACGRRSWKERERSVVPTSTSVLSTDCVLEYLSQSMQRNRSTNFYTYTSQTVVYIHRQQWWTQ